MTTLFNKVLQYRKENNIHPQNRNLRRWYGGKKKTMKKISKKSKRSKKMMKRNKKQYSYKKYKGGEGEELIIYFFQILYCVVNTCYGISKSIVNAYLPVADRDKSDSNNTDGTSED